MHSLHSQIALINHYNGNGGCHSGEVYVTEAVLSALIGESTTDWSLFACHTYVYAIVLVLRSYSRNNVSHLGCASAPTARGNHNIQPSELGISPSARGAQPRSIIMPTSYLCIDFKRETTQLQNEWRPHNAYAKCVSTRPLTDRCLHATLMYTQVYSYSGVTTAATSAIWA